MIADSQDTIVKCQRCGTNNRIRAHDPKLRPICAKCKNYLMEEAFDSPKEHEAKKYFDELLLKVEKKYKPIGEVGWAIVRASSNCRDAFKRQIQAATEKERLEHEMCTFYEFIYFYMHIMLRHAEVQLTEPQIEKLQNFLGPLISKVVVNCYCAHWPDDIKGKMIDEFYEKLNEALLEYSLCTFDPSKKQGEKASPERQLQMQHALFMRLGLNVSPHITNAEKDKATTESVARVAIAEWNRMGLDKLIAEVKKAN